jgi:hypothetical protein
MRTFQANQWLQTSENKKINNSKHSLESYSTVTTSSTEKKDDFTPSSFLIPGWKGGSLFSKSALLVKKAQEKLWKDAFHQFYRLESPNKSFKITVFNEFKEGYGFPNGEIPKELQNIDQFWRSLKDKNSPYRKNLIKFVEIYSFRVATVYLYKAKFLTTISEGLPYPLDINKLRSPSSTLSKIFPKGSSHELNCHSLQSNQYSWFRPSHESNNQLVYLLNHLKKIDISQLMKLSTYRGYKKRNGNINFKDQNYSHALSHCSYGKFINTLLVFFPIWHKKNQFEYPQTIEKYPQIYNTKFEGEKLQSLCHSHWLAQENNLHLKWSEIICPEFINNKEQENSFTKICHEIHFLTFLVKFAKAQNYSIKEIICHTFESKYRTSQNDLTGQFNLFSKATFNAPIRHQRIVLNLTDLPKKNPYHFLSHRIFEQKDKLCPNGYLYVFTNQNLFVPSQSNRLKQLLENFSVEARFNFEGLQGKGDIASHVYILKYRESEESSGKHKQLSELLSDNKSGHQEQCLSFIWRGEVNHFGQFNTIVSSLFDFFINRSPSKVSMIHNQIGDSISFEYHQDAIIEGRLLSTSNDDEKSITHPQFFKKLTQNCVPLEQFFLIDSLDKKKESITSDFLGISLTNTFKHQYVLVTDLRDPLYVNIDIIPAESYEGMREKNGVAFFQYFALTPKISQMNINIFKEYFNSHIGKQIIKLSLSGGPRKMKAKLNSLLVPGFFAEAGKSIPLEDQKSLSLIKTEIKDLMSLTPLDLKNKITDFFGAIERNYTTNPWMILGVLSQIKSKLINYQQNSNDGLIQYNNPLILNPLLKLDSYPVYPNKDIFLKLKIDKNEEIHRPLTKIKVSKEDGQSCLTLFSSEDEILQLFGEENLLLFIKFVLTSTEGRPISQIISNLKIPSATKLENILSNFDTVKNSIEVFREDVIAKIENIIKSTI